MVQRRVPSLRTQILTRTLLVGVLPLLVLGLVSLVALWRLSEAADDHADAARDGGTSGAATERLAAEAASTARELELATAERLTHLQRLAADPQLAASIRAAAPATTAAVLQAAVDARPEFAAVELTDQAGSAVVGAGRADLGAGITSAAAVDLRTQALAEGAAVGALTPDPDLGPLVPLAVRVDDGTGDPLGVLTAALTTDYIRTTADLRAAGGVAVIVAGPDLVVAATAVDHDQTLVGVVDPGPETLPAGLALARASVAVDDPADSTDTGSQPREGLGGVSTIADEGLLVAALAVTPGETGPGSTNAVPWLVVVESSAAVDGATAADLDSLATRIDSLRSELTLVVGFVLVATLLVALASSAVLVRKIVGPIDDLTGRAQSMADEELPTAVEAALTGEREGSEAPPLEVDKPRELVKLASSLNTVRETALYLAADQAAERTGVLELIGSLGRRKQTALDRQRRLIGDLLATEGDADRQGTLDRLDQVAKRMGRDARSFLVLAGERSETRIPNPVLASLVIERAIEQVEQRDRVVVGRVDDVAVLGYLALDLAHALAELIDNAVSFSPPQTEVELMASSTGEGLRIEVIDHGLGLSAARLADANARLIHGPGPHDPVSSRLGLVVANKLATRHDLRLRLVANDDAEGLTALIEVPSALVTEADRAVWPGDGSGPKPPLPPQHRAGPPTGQWHIGVIPDPGTVHGVDDEADPVAGSATGPEHDHGPQGDEQGPQPAEPRADTTTGHHADPWADLEPEQHTDPRAHLEPSGHADPWADLEPEQHTDPRAHLEPSGHADPWADLEPEQHTDPRAHLVAEPATGFGFGVGVGVDLEGSEIDSEIHGTVEPGGESDRGSGRDHEIVLLAEALAGAAADAEPDGTPDLTPGLSAATADEVPPTDGVPRWGPVAVPTATDDHGPGPNGNGNGNGNGRVLRGPGSEPEPDEPPGPEIPLRGSRLLPVPDRPDPSTSRYRELTSTSAARLSPVPRRQAQRTESHGADRSENQGENQGESQGGDQRETRSENQRAQQGEAGRGERHENGAAGHHGSPGAQPASAGIGPARRPLATTDSDEEVEAAARQVRHRWDRYRDGQRRAQEPDEGSPT